MIMKILVGLILAACIQFATPKPECKLSYKYTLWIGDNIDEIHSIKLQSPCGIVFYDAMQQAAEKNDQFAFESTSNPLYGEFITQISGVANDNAASKYWMIYDLESKPQVNNPPGDGLLASVGVSSLEVTNGHSYLFWYRTVTWT